MRTGTFLIAMFLAPSICSADSLLKAPSCALEAPLIKIAENAKEAALESQPPIVFQDAVNSRPVSEALDGLVLGTPVDIDRVPVLKHIAGTGAKITDLGSAHGLRSVLARHGEEFMLLEVTPDGEAVVAGLQSDLPVSKLLTIAGSQVTEMGSAHGLRGLFVRNGEQFQVLYATPDGERVIPGVMWDATGKNVTREQVTPITGAVPTAVIGKDTTASVPVGAKRSALDLVRGTTFGTSGPDSAPRLWVFVDPLCGYSVRALQELQLFVAGGKVQLAIIPVSVLDYEDQGRSTAAALAMVSKSADQMVTAWSRGDLKGHAGPEAAARLGVNMAAAEEIGLRGTPTVVWRKADGSEGRVDGLPDDWNAVIGSMGSESHAYLAR